MEKIRGHFKRQWKEYVGVLIMWLVIGLVLIFGYSCGTLT